MQADDLIAHLTDRQKMQVDSTRSAINMECTTMVLGLLEPESQCNEIPNNDTADRDPDPTSTELEELLSVPLYGTGNIFGHSGWQSPDDFDAEVLADGFESLGPDGQGQASIPDRLIPKAEYAGSAVLNLFASEDAFKQTMASIKGLVALYRTNPTEFPLYKTLQTELEGEYDPEKVCGKLVSQFVRAFSAVRATQSSKVTSSPASSSTGAYPGDEHDPESWTLVG